MKKAWMRILEIVLTSQEGKKQLKFGANWEQGKDDLSISVKGTKFMSTLKDRCTVEISNLSYSEVIQIIQGKFYDITIYAGYREGNRIKVFDGGILHISNAIDDTKSNRIIILCTSKLVARYGQSRINLTINSNINMYAALNLICRKAGIPVTNLSTQLKGKVIQNVFAKNESAANWINDFATADNSLIVSSDSIAGSYVDVFDANRSNRRVIPLNSNTIDLSGGYPQLTNEGLVFSIMPTFEFMCGDVISIDNSLINMPTRSQAEVSRNYGYYLDKDGHYMIFQIDFNLANRSSQFSLTLECKSRSLVSNYFGKE